MPIQIDTIHHHQLPYTAYLIRFWRDASNGPWRAAAQSVTTGEIVRFGSPQALFVFLEEEINKVKEQIPNES